MRQIRNISFFAYLLTAVISAKAQMISDTLLLEEFEVIAKLDDLKSPLNKTSIDSVQRREFDLSDMGELLSATTPIFVKSYGKGSLSTVSFRGTGATHTKVLWEGFDINSPMLGQTDFSTVPTTLFNKIELSYGGSSLTETGGALGGTVKIDNNTNNNNYNILNLSQSVGSFNTLSTSVNILLENNDISSSICYFRQSSDNDFTYLNNAILPWEEMKQSNADYLNQGFMETILFRVNEKNTIKTSSWNQWNKRNLPPIMTNVGTIGSHKEWQDEFFSRNILEWKYNGNKTTSEIKAAYFYENFNYFLETRNYIDSNVTTIESENKVNSLLLSGNVSTKINKWGILKTGIKYVNDAVNSNNYIDIKSRNLTSVFASLSFDSGKKITGELLIREELVNEDFSPLMPMIGLNYKPCDEKEFYLRFNISRNYNQPSLNDLYWYPGGNDSLKPEESLEAGLSADYSSKISNNSILVLRAAVYIASIDDWIMWAPGDYTYWTPLNIAKVLSNGIEISTKLSGKAGKFGYNIFAGYSYTRVTNRSEKAKENGTDNIQLMYVPINSFNGMAKINYHSYYFNWSIYYTDKRNTSLNTEDYYSNTLPAYTLNNVSIGKQGKILKTNYELRFRVNNIFNINYQAVIYRPMPQRNFEIIANISL